jgi:L-rhamnose mutarotase
MKTQHFSITIDAPKEKVWNTMLQDATYRKWTSVFDEGSHYKGSWEKGGKIQFLNAAGDGMSAIIAEHKPFEFISIKHIGFISGGVEDTESEQIKAWAPAFENYTLKEIDGKTEVTVDMDVTEEYEKMFEETWPKALQRLKELSE